MSLLGCVTNDAKVDNEDFSTTILYDTIPLEEVLLSSLFSGYEFIPLGNSSSKDQIIGELSKVYTTSNRYIVFDKDQVGGVVVYNEKGDQLFCILPERLLKN